VLLLGVPTILIVLPWTGRASRRAARPAQGQSCNVPLAAVTAAVR